MFMENNRNLMSEPNRQLSEGSLVQALAEYSETDAYPFHMPGHKRNPDYMALPPVNSIDITEIDGFDNLHHAEGILRKAQDRAALVRGAGRSWFLVNGSTCGLLAAISACTVRGGRILVARNCHKAVYNAIELRGLKPVYYYPAIDKHYGIYGAVDSEGIRRLLQKYAKIQAVVITSPTYEGVISDIGAIADTVHEFNIPLIVDCAHGAHLGYSEDFPLSPVSLGADLVIESLHKTLPSMTQTALLHLCGSRVNVRRLEKYLSIYQTSSPSYVMMASMDQCMELLQKHRTELFCSYSRRLMKLRSCFRELENIRLLGAGDLCSVQGSSYDNSKLVFYISKCPGKGQWLYDRLREDYHLQMEMVSADYVLAMTSICDTDEGFRRLEDAIKELDRRLCAKAPENLFSAKGAERATLLCLPDGGETPVLCSEEAAAYSTEWVDIKQACGRISQTYLYLYPPGVPFLVPGERITRQTLEVVRRYQCAGLTVLGMEEDEPSEDNGTWGKRIAVLKEAED